MFRTTTKFPAKEFAHSPLGAALVGGAVWSDRPDRYFKPLFIMFTLNGGLVNMIITNDRR
jgi:hypothetical protein